jgi:hypothetical protein
MPNYEVAKHQAADDGHGDRRGRHGVAYRLERP